MGKVLLRYFVCLIAVLVSVDSSAHPRWILPHEFNVSGSEELWVTFDLTASHAIFDFDKGISAENVRIFSPDGDQNYLASFFTGHRRSVFDIKLDQDGTYKVYEQRPLYYYTSYKSGKRDTEKYILANKIEASSRLPSQARDIETFLIDMSSVVYVTKNLPTDQVLRGSGEGLELLAITHPSDIVEGEKVQLLMHFDGGPVADVKIEITPAGTEYRDQRKAIQFTTDESGIVVFTPNQIGPWLVSATLTSSEKSLVADSRWSARYMSFEVSPK
jgi:uncharacterized GH25 family protein